MLYHSRKSTCDVVHGETAHGRAQHVCSPAECYTIHEKVLVMWCMARRHTDVPSTSVAPLNAIPLTNTKRIADTPKEVRKCAHIMHQLCYLLHYLTLTYSTT